MSTGKLQIRETVIERLARILSDQYGVKVVFCQDKCATDGKTIWLPAISKNASPKFMKALQGYLDHEVAHILFSDFDVAEESSKAGVNLKHMTNVLEDVRVEKKIIDLWRGSKINLFNCQESILESVSENWDKLPEFSKLITAINVVCQNKEDHWFINNHVKKDPVWDKIGVIDDLLADVGDLLGSEAALVRAREILKRLGIDNGDPEQPKPKLITVLTREEVMQAMAAKEPSSDRQYTALTTEDDEIVKIETGDKQKCAKLLADSRAITNSVRQKFRLNLLSFNKTKWLCNKQRGKVDSRAVFRVGLGTSKAVFKRKIVKPGFNTRCSLWIDHSYSMDGAKLRLASQAALIFGECLHELGIPFEVCGYSTRDYDIGVERYCNLPKADQDLYTRFGDLWVGVYKSFNDLWPSVRHKCASMVANCMYNTYDGESLKIAANRLLDHQENRKILFMLNDGYPCPNVNEVTNAHHEYLSEIAPEIEKHIEVIAIGIKSKSVSNFYKNYVILNELADLPTTMLTKLDSLLRNSNTAYSKAS